MSDDLNKRMKEAGMIPLSDILNSKSLGVFSVHTGVVDLNTFYEWLKMRHEEIVRAYIRMELDKKTDDEMYEWYLSHYAVFSEVLANFRAATGRHD